jgi:hypothetical protein
MKLFLIFILSLVILSSHILFADGEEVITIIPGSSDESRYRFFDITLFHIDIKKEFRFYNADNIPHQLEITKQDDLSFKDKTDLIGTKKSYSIELDKNGIYDFQSLKYPWMKGQIFVNDDSLTKTKKLELMNVQLSWIEDNYQKNKYHFKILFTKKNNDENLEHVDYMFTIKNSSGKNVHQSKFTHSGWGVEYSESTLDPTDEYVAEITVNGLLFQPIKVVKAIFDLNNK